MFTQELDPAHPDRGRPGGRRDRQRHAAGGRTPTPPTSRRASRCSRATSRSSRRARRRRAALRRGRATCSRRSATRPTRRRRRCQAMARIEPRRPPRQDHPHRSDDRRGRSRQPVLRRRRNPARCARRSTRAASATRTGSRSIPTTAPSTSATSAGTRGRCSNAFPTHVHRTPTSDRNAGWPCYEGGDGVALPQPDFEYAPATAGRVPGDLLARSRVAPASGVSAPLYGYRHDDPGGENGSAITVGPKYVGTSNYPAQYVGQLFIGDYARDRFQTVDPTTGVATDFGTPGGWGNPVDIQIAPDGNVAYLAIGTGELREIVYTGANHVPVAVATATQTSSPTAPFTVQFDGSQSSDADPGDTLTYDWDFADGTPDSTALSPTHDLHDGGLLRRHAHRLRRPSRRHRRDRPLDRRRQHAADRHVHEPGAVVPLHDRRHDQPPARRRGRRGRRASRARHVSTEVRLIHLDHFHPIIDFTGTHGVVHGDRPRLRRHVLRDHHDRDRPLRALDHVDVRHPAEQATGVDHEQPAGRGHVGRRRAGDDAVRLHVDRQRAPRDRRAGRPRRRRRPLRVQRVDAGLDHDQHRVLHVQHARRPAPRSTPTTRRPRRGSRSPTRSIVEGKSGTPHGRARRLAVDAAERAGDASTTRPSTVPARRRDRAVRLLADVGHAHVRAGSHEPGRRRRGQRRQDRRRRRAVRGRRCRTRTARPIVQGTGTVTIVDDDPGAGAAALGRRRRRCSRATTVCAPRTSPCRSRRRARAVSASTTRPSTGRATAPSDYTAVSGTLTFDAGVTSPDGRDPDHRRRRVRAERGVHRSRSRTRSARRSAARRHRSASPTTIPDPRSRSATCRRVEGNSGSRERVLHGLALDAERHSGRRRLGGHAPDDERRRRQAQDAARSRSRRASCPRRSR